MCGLNRAMIRGRSPVADCWRAPLARNTMGLRNRDWQRALLHILISLEPLTSQPCQVREH